MTIYKNYFAGKKTVKELVAILGRVPGVQKVYAGGSKEQPLSVYFYIDTAQIENALFLIGRCIDRNYGGKGWECKTHITDLPESKIGFHLETTGSGLVGPATTGRDALKMARHLIRQLEFYLGPEARHIRRAFGIPEPISDAPASEQEPPQSP